jgi:hypothetical protein
MLKRSHKFLIDSGFLLRYTAKKVIIKVASMKFSFSFLLLAFLLGSCDLSQGVQRNYIISHSPEEEVGQPATLEEKKP